MSDPCLFKGFTLTLKSEKLWREPCVKGDFAANQLGGSYDDATNKTSYNLVGTGDFDKCYKQIESMFNTSCATSSCGVNGVSEPQPQGHFYVSNIFYIYFHKAWMF